MPVAEQGVASRVAARAVVEVFADVTCPFAHVGLRRFVAHRVSLEVTKPVLRVRAWPLELVNGQPLDPATVGRHVDELREQVAPDLFRNFDPGLVPTSSMPALELVAAAYRLGDSPGERMSLRVRNALFEEGLDLARPDVLESIAVAESIPLPVTDAERLVLADLDEGMRRRVRGSPEFFIDGRAWYCPSLRIERVQGILRIEPDLEQVRSFLAACFG